MYDEVHAYLVKGEYPCNSTKQDKNSLRKTAKVSSMMHVIIIIDY